MKRQMTRDDWLMGQRAFGINLREQMRKLKEERDTAWMEYCGLRVAQELREKMDLEGDDYEGPSPDAPLATYEAADEKLKVLEQFVATLEQMQPPAEYK